VSGDRLDDAVVGDGEAARARVAGGEVDVDAERLDVLDRLALDVVVDRVPGGPVGVRDRQVLVDVGDDLVGLVGGELRVACVVGRRAP
jgi:Holliday junction resolvasome RuvABC ATP-dependent DNA helicase subunit